MHYIYIIKSKTYPEKFYIGFTNDLKKRLRDHNKGYSNHTKKFIPWDLESYFAFSDKLKAEDFEKYLKSGSGRAFCKKHF